MKIKKYFTVFVIFLCNYACAQTTVYYTPTGSTTFSSPSSSGCASPSSTLPCWYNNLQKYWYYRYRLVEDFTYIGPNTGEDMIAYRRTKGNDHDATINNTLDFAADQTNDLGTYIGVLATEYQQLKMNGFSTKQTLYELAYAQNAFDRLRKHGAEYYINIPTTTNYPLATEPSLITGDITNGFFLRDDVPFWDYINPGYTPSQNHAQHFNRPAISDPLGLNKGVTHCVGGALNGSYSGTDPATGHAISSSGGFPNCESQDQLNQLYIGEQLAIKYLDVSDPTAGPLKVRAENALYHSMKYLEHHEGSSFLFYSIPDPADPCCECAKHSCSSSGLFYFSALPAMYGLHGFMPSTSSWVSETYSLQLETDNFISYVAYASLMHSDILCCSYPLQNISYLDGYTCFGPEMATSLPGLGWLANYVIWRASSISHKREASWKIVKKHSEEFHLCDPHLPLIYEINFGDRSWAYHGDIETALGKAPTCGTWCYENSSDVWRIAGSEDYDNVYGQSFADWNWSGNSWVSDAGHRQGLDCYDLAGAECYRHGGADQHADCDYNGLDYMFLFNLYALERGGAGSPYLGGMMNSYYCDNFNVN
jgi:hypothetical protein